MDTYHRALTIAGSDSGGGAGIQADLKTFSALGCFGTSAITALTAQNTLGVASVHPVPPAFIAAQIDAVLDDIGTDATKIGMVHSGEAVEAVADRLRAHHTGPVVVDPVMVAASGDRLLREDAVEAMRRHLLPLASVLTPNVEEAAVLLDTEPIRSRAEMEDTCRALADLGPRAVLLKGGHLEGSRSVDVLYDRETDTFVELDGPRIDTPNTHGTGCTLSSALAAYLARGESLPAAARLAKEYMTGAIEAGAERHLGSDAGHGPVHHFFALWS